MPTCDHVPVNAELTRAALTALRPVFGNVGIIAETVLQDDDRATVVRLALITDVGARSVVVKSSKTTGVREPSAPDRDVSGPAKVLATHDDPPMVILED